MLIGRVIKCLMIKFCFEQYEFRRFKPQRPRRKERTQTLIYNIFLAALRALCVFNSFRKDFLDKLVFSLILLNKILFNSGLFDSEKFYLIRIQPAEEKAIDQ